MKKLLVTGISGFLASHLAQLNTKGYEIIGTYRTRPIKLNGIKSIAVDWADPLQAQRVFDQQQPDAVWHLAALSNPNYCEQHPEHSLAVNVDASVQLAALCQAAQIPFIFSSTDLVFDGQAAPYQEEDLAQPICVYGQHKLLAETKITATYAQSTIARLPLMYGWSTQGGFMKNWIDQLRKGNTIAAFTDEYRTPVNARCALQGLFLLLEKQAIGTWHLGGQQAISRYDLAVAIAKAYNLPTTSLIASLQKDVQLPAARPANVALNSHKAFALGYEPQEIEYALAQLAAQDQKGA